MDAYEEYIESLEGVLAPELIDTSYNTNGPTINTP